MALFERGNSSRYIPIHGTDETVDVTGAGDTVIAVFTLALAAGATYLEAAHIANYAGGIVVMKRRTATVTRAELEAALRADVTAAEVQSGMNTREKILSRGALVEELAAERGKGRRIVFANGCFDILHVGHVRYLAAARARRRFAGGGS